MNEFIQNPATVALGSAAITAVLLYLGRFTVDRRAGDQQFSNEIRDDLLEEVKQLKQEIIALKKDNDDWRNKYWGLQAEIAELKNALKGIGGYGV